MKKILLIALITLGFGNTVEASDLFHTCNATANAFAGSLVGFAGLGLFTRSMYITGKSIHTEMHTQEFVKLARKNVPMFIGGLVLLGVSSYFTSSSTFSEKALSDCSRNVCKIFENIASLGALSFVVYFGYQKGEQIEKRLTTLL